MQAKRALAEQWGCDAALFDVSRNVILASENSFFDMVTFGRNAVIRAGEDMRAWCLRMPEDMPADRMFDGENLYRIETKLRQHGRMLSGEHIRYLRAMDSMARKPDGFDYVLYEGADVAKLYGDRSFRQALNYDGGDVIALVAYAGDQIAAMAAADDDWGSLWQIGIDTALPFRGRGLAKYLVGALAAEIEARGMLPFYTTWSANVASTMTALGAGFRPAWVSHHAVKMAET